MENLTCIVHYSGQSAYSNIKNLSDINIDRIKTAKQKRLEVGEDNLHSEQIAQIPHDID